MRPDVDEDHVGAPGGFDVVRRDRRPEALLELPEPQRAGSAHDDPVRRKSPLPPQKVRQQQAGDVARADEGDPRENRLLHAPDRPPLRLQWLVLPSGFPRSAGRVPARGPVRF